MDPAVVIEPEALMGITGIKRILSGDLGRITVADKEAAEMMPREIRRALTRFVSDDDGPRKVGKSDVFDYSKALDQLTEAVSDDPDVPGLKQTVVEDIADSFKPEDHDLAAGYLDVAQRVIPYLQAILPIRVEQTMAKATNFDPSDTEIARFRRAYDVADDPMVILRDLEIGTLVSDQIGHLLACYPKMYANLKTQLGMAMANALAAKKSWKLPWRKERLVQVIYQTDTFTPGLAADLQKNFADTGKPTDKGAPSKATGKTATMFQTQTAATADGDLRKD